MTSLEQSIKNRVNVLRNMRTLKINPIHKPTLLYNLNKIKTKQLTKKKSFVNKDFDETEI